MNLKNIIEAANITGADSIHPGFGFLSENSQFAKICEESNIKFIGPSYKVIELMGNKSNAKDLMKKAGVPVIPGSDGSIQSLKGIIETANKIGLFGTYSGIIENLTLENVDIDVTKTNTEVPEEETEADIDAVGAFIGYANNTIIKNCKVNKSYLIPNPLNPL